MLATNVMTSNACRPASKFSKLMTSTDAFPVDCNRSCARETETDQSPRRQRCARPKRAAVPEVLHHNPHPGRGPGAGPRYRSARRDRRHCGSSNHPLAADLVQQRSTPLRMSRESVRGWRDLLLSMACNASQARALIGETTSRFVELWLIQSGSVGTVLILMSVRPLSRLINFIVAVLRARRALVNVTKSQVVA
jgi:hypothetical protein